MINYEEINKKIKKICKEYGFKYLKNKLIGAGEEASLGSKFVGGKVYLGKKIIHNIIIQKMGRITVFSDNKSNMGNSGLVNKIMSLNKN